MSRLICPCCLAFFEVRKVESRELYACDHCGLTILGNTSEEAEASWRRNAADFFDRRGKA